MEKQILCAFSRGEAYLKAPKGIRGNNTFRIVQCSLRDFRPVGNHHGSDEEAEKNNHYVHGAKGWVDGLL